MTDLHLTTDSRLQTHKECGWVKTCVYAKMAKFVLTCEKILKQNKCNFHKLKKSETAQTKTQCAWNEWEHIIEIRVLAVTVC